MKFRHLARRSSSAIASAVAVTLASTLYAAPPSTTGSGWDVVWADEFAGTSLDTYKWSAASPGWTMPNSAATASASQVAVGGGDLTLTATRTSSSAWSSGSVSTYSTLRFDGGYVEARVRLPSTAGSWPAFWGLYDGWPPEMDIMEYPLSAVSGSGYANDTYHTAFHYTNSSGSAASGAGPIDTNVDMRNTWHTFAADWVSDTKVDFYLDGSKKVSFTSGTDVAEMANMYMILDYAVGGWPGTPSTSQWAIGASDTTLVDYVRVWQQRPTGAGTTSTWATDGGGGWDTAANWSGIVPKYGSQQVAFGRAGANAAASSNVTWSGIRVVGGLTFDADSAYVLAGGSNASLQMVNGVGNASIRLLDTNGADQTINSRLEIQDATDISNASGKSLILNGLIIGGGTLNVDGPGTVQFSNNNVNFVGNTVIDSGAQGPAVARVTRSHPFGVTGTVYLGPGGNATTARIEIQDGRTVRNPIAFSGRNNVSAGIQNLSGNNTFSGTVSANVGGGTYLVQSDAGLLTFNGVDGGGVALTSAATGTRTFTLGGAGNGLVSGAITNGNATVALIKDGLGTWTLSGANTFTGGVNVTGGTLAADGNAALGSGAVTVGDGAALAVPAGRNVAGLAGLSVAAGGTLSLGGGGSELTLAGGVFTLGDVTLDLNHAYDAVGTYTLIDGVAGANAIGQATFADVNATYQYALSIVGTDAVLTVSPALIAVPEPTTLAALSLGAALLVRRRRVD